MRGKIQPNNVYELLGSTIQVVQKILPRRSFVPKKNEQGILLASLLKTSWVRKVSQGCMIKSLSSRVLHFKGVEVVVSEDKVHIAEGKTKDDGENVVRSVATKKVLFTV